MNSKGKRLFYVLMGVFFTLVVILNICYAFLYEIKPAVLPTFMALFGGDAHTALSLIT